VNLVDNSVGMIFSPFRVKSTRGAGPGAMTTYYRRNVKEIFMQHQFSQKRQQIPIEQQIRDTAYTRQEGFMACIRAAKTEDWRFERSVEFSDVFLNFTESEKRLKPAPH